MNLHCQANRRSRNENLWFGPSERGISIAWLGTGLAFPKAGQFRTNRSAIWPIVLVPVIAIVLDFLRLATV